ncbi:bifunctional metallophosphatase/5'-nucleotidase [Marinomonas transparens]|uniref:Bifunctional metallophosphatase/5'-nucleotidase n=1 Tax=Marinomonas transparens TaxID=2795388 RepID=A0A934JRH8_9GAMM|nr:5'-nucleotidase C-terminal domain-containing protein [Marinomonas transparens]MBJ7538724.1 bifunctional metallophosphatase/5'-nucleotidase [Marinomonas transparens]
MTKCHIFIKLCLFLSILFNTTAFAEQHATIIFDAQRPIINDIRKGSYAQLASLLNQERRNNLSTFFIFGGESLGPSMMSFMDRGAHIIDILNSLEPDAMGISKREFAFQEDELIIRSYEAAFPMVSSSLYDPLSQSAPDGILPYKVLKKGNVKLGFISALDPSKMEKYPVKRFQIIPPVEAITQAAAALKEHNVDLVILHYSDYMPVVNNLLEQGVVDVALFKDEYFQQNPYSHQQRHPNNIVIDESKNADVIQLSWQQDNPKDSLKINTNEVDLTALYFQPAVLQQVQEYDKRLDILLEEKIGKTTARIDLHRKTLRTSENSFANVVVDTLKDFTNAHLSLVNSGTIRSDTSFQANTELTRKDFLTMLPYRNNLVLLEVTGQQIIDALEHGLGKIESTSGRYLQVSGITVKYDSTQPAGKRLISVHMNGNQLVPTQSYRLATLDYLYKGGDGYTMLKTSKSLSFKQTSSLLFSDIVIAAVQKKGIISPYTDGRIENIAVKTTQ